MYRMCIHSPACCDTYCRKTRTANIAVWQLGTDIIGALQGAQQLCSMPAYRDGCKFSQLAACIPLYADWGVDWHTASTKCCCGDDTSFAAIGAEICHSRVHRQGDCVSSLTTAYNCACNGAWHVLAAHGVCAQLYSDEQFDEGKHDYLLPIDVFHHILC